MDRSGSNASPVRVSARRARRRVAGKLAAAVVVATAFGASPSPAVPSSSASVPTVESCLADAGVTFGSAGDRVACLQLALALMGYYQGELTGEYDQATSDAVVRYQVANPPLRVDGHVGQTMLGSIGIYSGTDLTPPPRCLADADLRIGDNGDGVRCLQSTLAEFGYFTEQVDGDFGLATAQAVTAYQKATPPLVADGVGNSSTLAALGIWSGISDHVPLVDDEPGGPTVAGPWPAGFQNEPFWNVNGEGIPYYGNRRQCSRQNADTIAFEFANDGAPVEVQQWAVYIASREGGCDHTAVNYNLQTRDDSHCTFQLNALAGMFEPWAELGRRGWNVVNVKESMANCADAASDLWVYCGKAPWTPPYGCTPPWKDDLGEGDA